MRGPAESLKRYITAGNPLLVSMLGLSGAVVFTHTAASAAAAVLSEIIVIAASVSVMFAFERVIHNKNAGSAAKLVFFASAAAFTSLCGAMISRFLPDIWSDVGAPFPLLAVGSIALVSAEQSGETYSERIGGAVARVFGCVAVIIVVAVVRQLAEPLHFFETSGGALILVGILAACLRAAYTAYGMRTAREVYGADSDAFDARKMRKANIDTNDTDDTDDAIDTDENGGAGEIITEEPHDPDGLDGGIIVLKHDAHDAHHAHGGGRNADIIDDADESDDLIEMLLSDMDDEDKKDGDGA